MLTGMTITFVIRRPSCVNKMRKWSFNNKRGGCDEKYNKPDFNGYN